MTTIDGILQKMEQGKTYRLSDFEAQDATVKSQIARASKMGLICNVARGCYEITPLGLESAKWYNIDRKKLLSRENINDVPWIAWPV